MLWGKRGSGSARYGTGILLFPSTHFPDIGIRSKLPGFGFWLRSVLGYGTTKETQCNGFLKRQPT